MRSFSLLMLLIGLCATTQADSPTPDVGDLQEAIHHFEAQELASAEKLFLTALESPPGKAEATYYLGRVYLSQGRTKEAVEAFEDAIRLDATQAPFQFWLAEALVARIEEVSIFFKLGLAKRMREAYEKAVDLDPDHLEARISVARYHSEAPAIAGGRTERAETEMTEIRRRDPALARVTQGLIHEQLGRLDEALLELEAAVELDPESLISWTELGYFYQRQERWQDARLAFAKVLARAPEDPIALYEGARTELVLSEQHQLRARQNLEVYLQLKPAPEPVLLNNAVPPRRAVAHHRLGEIYERLGELGQAVREYEAAVGLDGSDQALQQALARARNSGACLAAVQVEKD